VSGGVREIEDGRRIAPALLDKLHGPAVRLLLPRSIQGDEADPVTFFHVIGTIPAATPRRWCLARPGCAMTAAYLEPRRARDVRRCARGAGVGPGP